MSNQTASKKTIGGTAKSVSREQEQTRWLVYRMKALPEQLARAYRRVEQLEKEAVSLGLSDIIRRP